jgi:hypothetical protein
MDTTTGTESPLPGGLERLMTAEDLAAYLGIPVSAVETGGARAKDRAGCGSASICVIS